MLQSKPYVIPCGAAIKMETGKIIQFPTYDEAYEYYVEREKRSSEDSETAILYEAR